MPIVAVPIHATAPLGLDTVPALVKASDNDSSLANEPVPQVMTVATGSIKPLVVWLRLSESKPLTPQKPL